MAPQAKACGAIFYSSPTSNTFQQIIQRFASSPTTMREIYKLVTPFRPTYILQKIIYNALALLI